MLNSYHQTNMALGSKVDLVLVSGNAKNQIDNLFDNLWNIIFQFETRFSRFLANSELSLFNKNAGQKTDISDEFRELLIRAKEFSVSTEGLFNPFVLPVLHKVGYKQSHVKKYANDWQEDYSKRHMVDISNLNIQGNTATIPWGTAIDFGGLGKGYLADKLADSLPKDIVGYWLSIGGDISTYGNDEKGEKWRIQIEDAQNRPKTLKNWVVLAPSKRFAVASSSILERKGPNWHHIIDARSQLPAQSDVAVATVCCDDTVRADVLAKLAIVLGSSNSVAKKLHSLGAKSLLLQCITENGQMEVKHFGSKIISGEG